MADDEAGATVRAPPERSCACGCPQALQERDAAPEDVRVLRALRGIFDVFAAPPDARAAAGAAGARDAAHAGGAQPAAGGARVACPEVCKRSAWNTEPCKRWLCRPQVVRGWRSDCAAGR
jgi:hypothetical protein